MFDQYEAALTTTDPKMLQSWLDHSMWEHRYQDSHDVNRRKQIQLGLANNENLPEYTMLDLFEQSPFHTVKDILQERHADIEERCEQRKQLMQARSSETPVEVLETLFEASKRGGTGEYNESILCSLSENTVTPLWILRELYFYPDDIGGAAATMLAWHRDNKH
jgi:hypothetical protein